MHICLPDMREVKPPHGSAFLLYNVHIDGLYHCSLRFKQLLHLHQTLAKKFTSPYYQLPQFPPKKLLPLSAAQTEERRTQLEKYLQSISQDKSICNSSIFNLFLLEAQRESTRIRENQVHLDIELVNGQKMRVQTMSHDSVDAVLTAVCRALGLPDRYHAYFCLCLCGYDVIRDKLIIKRRLSFFESPYVTLQMAIHQQEQLQNVLSSSYSTSLSTLSDSNPSCCRCPSCSSQHQQQSATSVLSVGSSSGSYVNNHQLPNCHFNQHHQYHVGNRISCCYHQSNSTNGNRQAFLSASSTSSANSFVTHRILLRKSYWDPIYDTYILNDQQAMNLLFIQTVYDMKHSLMFVNRETYHQLESLLASDSKMEYILLARTLKYYNYVHFEPCLSDYPRPRTKVMISIGSKELNMRVLKSPKALPSTSTPANMASLASTTMSAPLTATSSNTPVPKTTTSTTTTTNTTTTTTSTTTTATSTTTNTITNQQVTNEQILYCTSSLVPSGYHHLITKDDLVEEEYNFKVPLIRCWRLTSLETLNNCNHNTLVTSNERRKSLSLFNSVLGSNLSSCSENRQNESPQSGLMSSSGTGGSSLMAALTGHTINGNGYGRHTNGNGHHHQHGLHYNQQAIDNTQFSQYELSFEYLVSKDTLKWITISSDQAIFISISLQGVVDELVSKRDDRAGLYKGAESLNLVAPMQSDRVSRHNQNFTYMCRDGTQKVLNTSNQKLIDKFGTTLGYSPMNSYTMALARQRQQIRSSENSSHQTAFEISNLKKAPSPIINDAFEGVNNDDDL